MRTEEIEHQELELISTDKLRLHGQVWKPIGSPKAIVLLSHGLSDRSERFAHWGQLFAKAGYAFCCFDTRGNGKSEGQRGHCNCYEEFLDDIDLVLEWIKSTFPDVPIILYGHSMGGNLISNFIIRRQPKVDAAIITSPWLKLSTEPNAILQFLAKTLGKLWPTFNQKANIVAPHLCANKEVVQAYIDDSLIHDRITPACFLSLQEAGVWAINNASKISLSTLLMQEKGDRITSFEATKEFVRNAGSRVTFKEWEGDFHELHNEPFASEVFDIIMDWLNTTL